MNQQFHSKVVQSWADNQKVVSGNHCRLIDNFIKKNNFQFDAILVLNSFVQNYSILLDGGVA
jgi:hypothetical protein